MSATDASPSRRVAASRVRGAPAALTFVLLLSCGIESLAGGVIDVELENGRAMSGTLDPPTELESCRVRVPAGVSLDVEVTSSPDAIDFELRLFGPDDAEVLPLPPAQRDGNVTRIENAPLASAGLYRLDIRGEGVDATDYQVRCSWGVSRTLSGSAGPTPLTTTFPALAGAAGALTFSSDPAGLTVELVDPTGNVRAVGPFASGEAGALPLDLTGDYEVRISSASPTDVSAVVSVDPPTSAQAAINVREGSPAVRERRIVTRIVDADDAVAGVVTFEVSALDDDQRVPVDHSGTTLSADPTRFPTPFRVEVATASNIVSGGSRSYSAAGVATSVVARLAEPLGKGEKRPPDPLLVATLELPFDVGEFPLGTEALRVFRRVGGRLKAVPEATYDFSKIADGVVSFPTIGSGTYQVVGPKRVLRVAARLKGPEDLAPGPDGTVYVADSVDDTVSRWDPSTRKLQRVAGGGLAVLDGAAAIDFDLSLGQQDLHIAGIEALADGSLVVGVSSRQFGTPGFLLRATPGGSVFRIAGNGTATYGEGDVARDSGLPNLRRFAADGQGNIFVIVDGPSPDLPETGGTYRIARIDAETGTISTVAGGAEFSESPDDGKDPLAVDLSDALSIAVDSTGRVLVGGYSVVWRFDLEQKTTEVLVGASDHDRQEAAALQGQGAPLRAIEIGWMEDIAFVPGGGDDVLYGADGGTNLVWRFDLARGRGYIAAGPSLSVNRVLRGKRRADSLSSPNAVLQQGLSLFIAERGARRLRVLETRTPADR